MTFDIQLCSLGEYQTLEDQLTKKCKVVGLTEKEYELEFSHTRNCLNEALSEWWTSENK